MIYNTPIDIYDGSLTKVGSIIADMQDFDKSVSFDCYSFKISKRIFCDINSLITDTSYINVENNIYKVLRIKTYSNYMEVWLSEWNYNDVTINDISAKGLFIDIGNTNYWQDKTFITNTSITAGNIVKYNNRTFIVNTQVIPYKGLFITTVRECNYTIKIVVNGKLYEWNAYTDNSSLTVNYSNSLITPAGSITMVIPKTSVSNSLDENLRFIKFNSAWKISGISGEYDGLIKVFALRDTFADGDDKVNEIANANTITHTYTVSITNKTENSVIMGNTIQYTATATKDGDIVSNPSITWSSSDTNIATVDSNGLVTSVAIGTTTITASYQSATDNLTLAVQETPHTYTVAINPDTTSINAGSTQQYTATCTDNGNSVSNPTVTWTSSDTSIATVDSTGLVTGVAAGSFTLTCTYENVTATKSITIAQADVITYKWWNADTLGGTKTYYTGSNHVKILQGSTKYFGVDKYVNGNVSTQNIPCTFVINTNGASTSNMTYTINDTYVQVTNVSMYNNGYPYITATPTESGTQLSVQITIQLGGRF